MDKCPICRQMLDDESVFYIEVDEKTNTDIRCCSKCEEQYDIVLNGEQASDVKKAINYFYAHLKNVEEPALRSFLMEVIENNAEYIEQKETAQSNREQNNDYFQTVKEKEEYHWIQNAEKIVWICFFVILIADFAVMVSLFSINFLTGLLVGAVVFTMAYCALTSAMVFLEMAKDIKQIRIKMKK